MALEIERKFLLTSDAWRDQVEKSIPMQQGYFCNTDRASLRIRITEHNAQLGIKSMTHAIRRQEFEYPVPMEEARALLDLCQPSIIIKTRYHVSFKGHLWEIDEFSGENAGLIVAEIELQSELEKFAKPEWLGREASDDPRYLNFSLASHPFKQWTT